MFIRGFHNIIDLYPYVHNKVGIGRGSGNQGYFDKDKKMLDVSCRIRASNDFKGYKIFFSPDVKINQGDGIYDKQNNVLYTVINSKEVYSFKKVHHITCYITKSFEKVDGINE